MQSSKNFIYYGPPGTGKTYAMQKRASEYYDYSISDSKIVERYTSYSQEWLLISLILFQSMGMMDPPAIRKKIDSLGITMPSAVSSVLERHSVSKSKLITMAEMPAIFFEPKHGFWYVDRQKLLQYQSDFFSIHIGNASVYERFKFVTFHQSFSYEDFVEGIRPKYMSTTNTVDYSPSPGVFVELCEVARANPEKDYAIFIDEINRGNVSEIFGDLISLIEDDKREGCGNELRAILPYSKKSFCVPRNVYIGPAE